MSDSNTPVTDQWQPDSPEDWRQRALSRGSDAHAIAKRNEESVGAVYFAGIAVECAVKGFYQLEHGKEPPHKHEIDELVDEIDSLSYRDIVPAGREDVAFFLSEWEVDLRYSSRVPGQWSCGELVKAGRQIVNRLTKQIQRRAR